MSFPSPEQAAVIAHRGKPLIVVAGPGTGKTTTLVERMVGLIREDQSRQVSFITFSRMSRRDTHTRLQNALGEKSEDESPIELPRVSTLHTYAKGLVHRYSSVLEREPNFSVLISVQGEKDLVLEEVILDLQLNIELEVLRDAIYTFRCTDEWPIGLPLSTADRLRVHEQFNYLLRFYRAFDIEGLVISACEILTSDQEQIPPLFLQVDEYQDLNPLDQRFVRLAAANPASQVAIVADDAQSIYMFRHAHFEGVRALWDSPKWMRIRLPDCHRLPPHILNAALDLIEDEGYLGAEMNRKEHDGRQITTLQCTSSDLQIHAVAQRILQLYELSIQEDEEPIRLKDFLILCPTIVQANRTVEILKNRHDIETHMPARPHIPDSYWKLVLILRILNSEDPLALRQWLPNIGLTSDEILELRRVAMLAGFDLYHHCQMQADERLLRFFGMIENFHEMVDEIDSFARAFERMDGLPDQSEFIERLRANLEKEQISLPSIGKVIQFIYEWFGVVDPGEIIFEDNKVLVATLHSAKGLEAEYVFCLWMNGTFMPMSDRDPREQRRLLYVALTRAKRDVVLTFHEVYDADRRRRVYEQALSPYLRGINDHLEIIRVRARDLT